MRGRGTQLNVLLVGALILAIAAVAVSRGGTATSSPSPAGAAGTPQRAAETFASAYLRYLDGQIAVTALPGASARVRAIANDSVIPPRDRAGTLNLTGLVVYDDSGSLAQANFAGRDQRHGYPAHISLTRLRGGWGVVGLVPPDLDTILAPRARPQPIPTQARAAATAFALAYVDYREGARRGLPSGLPLVRKQMTTGKDPFARIRPTHTAASLSSLKFGPVGKGIVDLTAALRDRGSPVSVSFILKHAGGRWQAWWLLQGTAG